MTYQNTNQLNFQKLNLVFSLYLVYNKIVNCQHLLIWRHNKTSSRCLACQIKHLINAIFAVSIIKLTIFSHIQPISII